VIVDKGALLAPRLGEDTHEIEGVGTVRIRGLSRAEVLAAQKLGDVAKSDRFMVSRALLEPTLTEADVQAWQESSSAGEIEGLTVAIATLSGLGVGASKSGVSGVRE